MAPHQQLVAPDLPDIQPAAWTAASPAAKGILRLSLASRIGGHQSKSSLVRFPLVVNHTLQSRKGWGSHRQVIGKPYLSGRW